MEKIIIKNTSLLDMTDVLPWIAKIINQGKLEIDGKFRCYRRESVFEHPDCDMPVYINVDFQDYANYFTIHHNDNKDS